MGKKFSCVLFFLLFSFTFLFSPVHAEVADRANSEDLNVTDKKVVISGISWLSRSKVKENDRRIFYYYNADMYKASYELNSKDLSTCPYTVDLSLFSHGEDDTNEGKLVDKFPHENFRCRSMESWNAKHCDLFWSFASGEKANYYCQQLLVQGIDVNGNKTDDQFQLMLPELEFSLKTSVSNLGSKKLLIKRECGSARNFRINSLISVTDRNNLVAKPTAIDLGGVLEFSLDDLFFPNDEEGEFFERVIKLDFEVEDEQGNIDFIRYELCIICFYDDSKETIDRSDLGVQRYILQREDSITRQKNAEDTVKSIGGKIADATKGIKNAEADEAKANNDRVATDQKITNFSISIATAVGKISKADEDKMTAKKILDASNKEYTAANEALVRVGKKLEAANKDFENASQREKNANSKVQELNKDEKAKELIEAKKTLAAARETQEEAEKEFASADKVKQEKEQDLKKAKDEFAKESEKVSTAEKSAKTAEQTKEGLVKEIEKLGKEVSGAKKDTIDATRAVENMDAEISELQKLVASTASKFEESKNKKQAQERELKRTEEEKAPIVAEINKVNLEKERYIKLTKDTTDKISKIRENVASGGKSLLSKEELKSLNDELDNAKKEEALYQKKVTELEILLAEKINEARVQGRNAGKESGQATAKRARQDVEFMDKYGVSGLQ